MQYGQHVDLAFQCDGIDDQIREADDGKLPCPIHLPGATQKRERPEHHRRLDDPADHPISRSAIVFGDLVSDRLKVVLRLRRKANPQA